MSEAWLYIMSSRKNGPLYVGVTNNMIRRATEHRTGAVKGFTARYRLRRLVYFERHESIAAAIQRETTIKGWVARLEGPPDQFDQSELGRPL